MRFLGIIPARYASTRFPGKPLVDIAGKRMVQRVYERAAEMLEEVWVATDDARIEEAVKGFGGKVVMTSQACSSGTDRCREAVEKIAAATHRSFDVVINIQGDEPLLHPEMLENLMSCFEDDTAEIATLVNPIVHQEDIFNQGEVKVVFDRNKEALYFSRSPVPYVMEADKADWLERHRFYKHVGVYAYRIDVLRRITELPVSPLEATERLEQNRWLENGYRIKVEITDHESVPVDTPEDLERVQRLLEKEPLSPTRRTAKK
jgi:3-deoxy-manno-octulosonate cytidylyltransferase (CMP-KDO synthetase)